MYLLQNHVGRLVEFRLVAPLSLEDAHGVRASLFEVLRRLSSKIVICGDLRAIEVLRPEIADTFLALMKHDNPRVERHAMICTPSATLALQVNRLIREAGSDARRLFTDVDAACRWLNEVLEVPERARMRAFLDRADTSP